MEDRKIKILIIDDVSENIQILARMIEHAGYHICFALDGEKGIDLVRNNKIDLILCDVMMPGMDGFEVCKTLKSEPKYENIPIIFVTGKSEEDAVVEGFNVGAVDYISKPFKKQEILVRIKTHLDLKFSRESLQHSYEELSRISEACQLFVPERFLNQILSKDVKQKFKPKRFQAEKFSILFTDVKSYTKNAEHMKLQQIFEFLNRLFEMMEPVISNNHGFVDKFIGDAIMACFDKESSADHAVMAAIKIQEVLKGFNASGVSEEIKIGIGIDTGEVMVGTMGTKDRLNPTVIGNHVNMASRLESLNKHYNTKLLISEWTYVELTQDRFELREVDIVWVDEEAKSVVIYEVLDVDPQDILSRKKYTRRKLYEGIRLYKKKKFSEAWFCFKECLEHFPEDVVAQKYLKKCRFYQNNYPKGVEFKWDESNNKRDFLLNQPMHIRLPRIPAHIDVGICFKGKSLNTRSKDISAGGAKLLCEEALDEGAIVYSELNLPSRDERERVPMQMMSRVAWRDYDEEIGKYQIGLEFLTLSLEEEKVITNLIGQYEKDII